VDALAFDAAPAGLRLGHGLVLQRVHARQAPDGLLVELDGGLRILARRILGIEGGEAGVEMGARVHVASVARGAWPGKRCVGGGQIAHPTRVGCRVGNMPTFYPPVVNM